MNCDKHHLPVFAIQLHHGQNGRIIIQVSSGLTAEPPFDCLGVCVAVGKPDTLSFLHSEPPRKAGVQPEPLHFPESPGCCK